MSQDILFPLLLSLKVASAATACAGILAIACAYAMAHNQGIFHTFLDSLCTLPLVLPPTVLGYCLIVLLGKKGVLGSWLYEHGIQLMFTWQGAVIACTAVIFPLIYKYSRVAFSQVDKKLEDCARTLGASEYRIFFTVSLPLAFKGIFAGLILAFARGLGEFGATLMIAGNIPHKTQTLALAIYASFQSGEDDKALFLVLLTSLLCVCILCLAEYCMEKRKYA